MNKKRWLALGTVFTILAALLISCTATDSTAAPEAETAVATIGDLSASATASGSVTPRRCASSSWSRTRSSPRRRPPTRPSRPGPSGTRRGAQVTDLGASRRCGVRPRCGDAAACTRDPSYVRRDRLDGASRRCGVRPCDRFSVRRGRLGGAREAGRMLVTTRSSATHSRDFAHAPATRGSPSRVRGRVLHLCASLCRNFAGM